MNNLTRKFSELSKGAKIAIAVCAFIALSIIGNIINALTPTPPASEHKAAPVTTTATTAAAADKEAKKAELEAKNQAKEEEKARKEEEKARKEAERKEEEARKQFEKDNDDDHINAMDKSRANILCEHQAKPRANHPDTVKFGPYNSKDVKKSDEGDKWIVDTTMSAENSFGVRDEYELRCYVAPSSKDEAMVTTLIGDEILQDAVQQMVELEQQRAGQPQQ